MHIKDFQAHFMFYTQYQYHKSLLTGLCFLPFAPGTDPRFAVDEDGWWDAAMACG